MDEESTYKTRDIALASYLIAKKCKFLFIEKGPSSGKADFCFEDDDHLAGEVAAFLERRATVDVHENSAAFRFLKKLLHGDIHEGGKR